MAGYMMDPPRAESDAGARPPTMTPPAQTNCGVGITNCGGVCRDTSNDRDNCGACGRVCATGQICLAGFCRVLETPVTCGSGLLNCNGSCRDVRLDDANCGACGTVCAMGQTCTAGRCVAPQPPPASTPTCRTRDTIEVILPPGFQGRCPGGMRVVLHGNALREDAQVGSGGYSDAAYGVPRYYSAQSASLSLSVVHGLWSGGHIDWSGYCPGTDQWAKGR
jgi:hypothetical protein